MLLWLIAIALLLQIVSFTPVFRPYNYSNTFNLKQCNSKNIQMINICVVSDMSVFRRPFAK